MGAGLAGLVSGVWSMLPAQTVQMLLPLSPIDDWLRSQGSRKPTRVLANGTGFGCLHERLVGKPLSQSLLFTHQDDDATGAWWELLEHGTFRDWLDRDPESFQVDNAWVELLKVSLKKHGSTWLHALHLGISGEQSNLPIHMNYASW